MDGEANAPDDADRAGVARDAYERRVVDAVTATLDGMAQRWTVKGVSVDDGRVAVTFTADLRPGYTFVWRSWPLPPPDDRDDTAEEVGHGLAYILDEGVSQGGMIALTPSDEHRVVLLDHYA